MKRTLLLMFFFGLLLVLLSACGTAGTNTPVPTNTPQPTQARPTIPATWTPAATDTPTITPTPTLQPMLTPTAGPTPVGGTGKVVFALARRADGVISAQGVFIYDFVNGTLNQPLETGFDLQSISPDGLFLLANQGNSLYLVRVAKPDERLLLAEDFYPLGRQGATWSKDGKFVIAILTRNNVNGLYSRAFDSQPASPKALDQTISPDDWKALNTAGYAPIELYPSPGAARIYWASGTCNAPGDCNRVQVFRSPVEGTVAEEVTLLERPQFTADIKWMAYLAIFNNQRYLAVAPLDRSAVLTPFMGGGTVSDYAWSPVSNRLAALSVDRSDYSGKVAGIRVFVMEEPSFEVSEKSTIDGLNGRVVWSDDGNVLLVTSTAQLESGGFRISFHLHDLLAPRMDTLDEKINLTSPDFIYITNIFWVPAYW